MKNHVFIIISLSVCITISGQTINKSNNRVVGGTDTALGRRSRVIDFMMIEI